MRRAVLPCVVLALAVTPAAVAKFGISKTRVTLPRTRPPEIPILAGKVFLDVRADAPEVRGAYVDTVRDRVAAALERTELYRLVDQPRESQASVKVSLGDLRAEVRDEVRTEVKYVKVGERQEWDSKKNKYVTKDVWANREFLVPWRLAEGSLSARVTVDDGHDRRSSEVGSSYSQSYKTDSVPPEARGEESLRQFLVEETAGRAAGVVAYSPDPVEALLAVNGELKDGNKLAEAGRFEDALGRWSSRTLKGDTEAARLHNVGVAHEAMAYRLPLDSDDHRRELEEARDFYRKAINLDPDEKYFKPPLERIDVSLGYAEAARRFVEELDRFRGTGNEPGPRARKGASRPDDQAVKTTGRPVAPPPPTMPPNVAVKGTPLRNGSFESSYNFWALVGKGNVIDDPTRGRVFEAASGGAETILRQEVDILTPEGASLSLEYRVVSGRPGLRVVVEYLDEDGQERSSSLEVARRATAGDWSPWTGDLSALRPRPARVTGVRLVSGSGSLRIDNVALTPR